MKKKTMVIASVLMMAMCVTACGSKPANDQPAAGGQTDQPKQAQAINISFASGGTSGTYYPYASAVATAWNENIEGMNCAVEATGASQENINLVSKGEAEVAIVQNDVMTYAYNGTENFEGKQTQNFSTIGTVYSEVCQIVASPDANIKSVADLKGKRVSVGDIGSGVEANSRQILAAYGLTFDDIKVQNLGFGPSADAIKDGSLDAVFVTAGIPTTAVMELATAQENAGGKHRPADQAALGLLAPDDAQDQTDHSHCRTRGHQIGQCGVACEKLIGGAVHIEAADDQQIDLRHAAGQKKLERVVHGLVPLYRLGFTDRIFGHIGQPPGCLFRK